MDAQGVTTRFTYDALNRLTLMDYPDNSQDVTFTYDTCTNGIGRLCGMTDESGSTSYTYDARGNLTSQTTTIDGITKTVGYAYNSADQLVQMTYPGGRTVDYTRNVLGQINTVTTTQGTAATVAGSFTYEPFGPMNAMTYGNGLIHARSYDLDYRLTNLVSGAVQDLTYTLDAANNITAITNNADATRSQTLAYDELNRLTDASGIYGDLDYSYDANGNRTSDAINSNLRTYTYDTVSHHLLQTVNGGTMDYSYDQNGNTTNNTDFTFTYGDNNRLQEARISGAPVAVHTYNGRGERVKKAGTATTLYYYDQNGQLIAELDAAGTTLREYIYVDGQPLAYVTGGSVHFIHVDHLGTPQVLTDGAQTVAWQADYEPFGQVNITTETVTNNLRFPGQYYDQETNLHYNYFRTYDPSIGRYIESDPIGLKGGINTYTYVLQNPNKYVDPVGLFRVSNRTGQDRSNELGTVVCSGDIFDPFRPEMFISKEDCRYECAYQHEEKHIEDIKKRDPYICRGMKPGLRIDPEPGGVQGKWAEIRGYQKEFACLEASLEKCPKNECNIEWVLRQILVREALRYLGEQI